MARLRKATEILAAAERWKEKCLLGGGSVFSEQKLWTRENFDALNKHFVQNLDYGKRGFWEKLEEQLADAPQSAKQLAAEMFWVMFLICAPGTMKWETKKDQIRTVWSWSGDELPDNHAELGEMLSKGVVITGLGFSTHRWREFRFFILAMQDWVNHSAKKQRELIADAWAFAQWLESQDKSEARQLRHILLFLIFPEQFERSATGRDKRAIVQNFYKKWDVIDNVNYNDRVDVDRHLLAVRERLQKEAPKTEVDFYTAPYKEEWKKPKTPKKAESKLVSMVSEAEPPEYSSEDALEDLFLAEEKFSRIVNALAQRKNLILQGPPGVGKTFIAKRIAWHLIGSKKKKETVAMVQFHQSYAYEDFVQGYRPTETGGFELRNGPFYEFCKSAAKDSETPYVFIIDEINRGNLSRIFGELLMLIESDKRGDKHAIRLTYSPEGETFSVPENVYILGMMNTADRSLAMVDYALRRRFAFVSLFPAFETEAFRSHLLSADVDEAVVEIINERMQQLNDEIAKDTKNLGPGYAIGHSYFVPTEADATLDRAWYEEIIRTQIEPLLREYWFDQNERANEVLARLLA